LTDYLVSGARVPPPPRVDVPEAELRAWVGHYHLANPRMQLVAFIQRLLPALVVSLEDGRLVVDDPIPRARLPLVALGHDRFRYDAASGSHVAFGRDTEGRRALHHSGMYFVEEPAFLASLFAYGARAVFWLLLSALALPFAAIAWRGRAAPMGWAWPLVSLVSLFAVPTLFVAAAIAHALGDCNAYTVGICALTVAFAVGAVGATVQAVRRLGQPLPLIVRLHRLMVAVAALSATVFFAYYRLVGICLWRY
jgi:hypothetical protein